MYEYLTYFKDIDTNRPEPFSRVDNTMLNHICATEGWRVVNSGMVNSLKRGIQQIQWVHLLEREKKVKHG